MEGLTFCEQAALYARAKVVVVHHGASLANGLFLRQESLMVEMNRQWDNQQPPHFVPALYGAGYQGLFLSSGVSYIGARVAYGVWGNSRSARNAKNDGHADADGIVRWQLNRPIQYDFNDAKMAIGINASRWEQVLDVVDRIVVPRLGQPRAGPRRGAAASLHPHAEKGSARRSASFSSLRAKKSASRMPEGGDGHAAHNAAQNVTSARRKPTKHEGQKERPTLALEGKRLAMTQQHRLIASNDTYFSVKNSYSGSQEVIEADKAARKRDAARPIPPPAEVLTYTEGFKDGLLSAGILSMLLGVLYISFLYCTRCLQWHRSKGTAHAPGAGEEQADRASAAE